MVSLAKPKDFCMALILLAFSGVMYYQTIPLDSGITHALGPAFFPRLLLYFIAFVSLILLAQSFRLRPALAEPAPAEICGEAGDKDGPCGREALIMQWGFVALLLVYIFLLPYLGYALGTSLFLLAGMILVGPHKFRNFIIYGVVSLAVTFGLQFVFGNMLHLFLP